MPDLPHRHPSMKCWVKTTTHFELQSGDGRARSCSRTEIIMAGHREVNEPCSSWIVTSRHKLVESCLQSDVLSIRKCA